MCPWGHIFSPLSKWEYHLSSLVGEYKSWSCPVTAFFKQLMLTICMAWPLKSHRHTTLRPNILGPQRLPIKRQRFTWNRGQKSEVEPTSDLFLFYLFWQLSASYIASKSFVHRSKWRTKRRLKQTVRETTQLKRQDFQPALAGSSCASFGPLG